MMSTCNRLNLQTLGSQAIMPKILPIIVSHATLIVYYHAFILTLHTSFISRALWLPRGSMILGRS